MGTRGANGFISLGGGAAVLNAVSAFLDITFGRATTPFPFSPSLPFGEEKYYSAFKCKFLLALFPSLGPALKEEEREEVPTHPHFLVGTAIHGIHGGRQTLLLSLPQ